MEWSVVMPVKGAVGKSRLDAGDARAALAVAFARDAIAAALAADAVARVIVVTADRDVVRGLPVSVVEDRGAGLRAAIDDGLAALDDDGPAAVLLADLPALAPGDVDAALALAAAEDRAFVPDARGMGTTLLTVRAASDLRPRFGDGSAAQHAAEGHLRRRLAGVQPECRRGRPDAGALERGHRIRVLLGHEPAVEQPAVAAGAVVQAHRQRRRREADRGEALRGHAAHGAAADDRRHADDGRGRRRERRARPGCRGSCRSRRPGSRARRARRRRPRSPRAPPV